MKLKNVFLSLVGVAILFGTFGTADAQYYHHHHHRCVWRHHHRFCR